MEPNKKPKAPAKKKTATKKRATAKTQVSKASSVMPVSTNLFETRGSTNVRGSRKTHSQRNTATMAGELQNIDTGVTPFTKDNSGVSVSEAIKLSQKAYWNVSIYRMTIDIMTEFSNSPMHFRGGNASTRKFYEKWYNKINGWKLGDQFFREWYRSGNVFFYRLDGQMPNKDVRKMSRAVEEPTLSRKVPIRYVLLNPADIRCNNAASFVDAEYSKLINEYELARLKNPRTDEEKEFKRSLPAETRREIDNGSAPIITLNQEQLHSIFCKKQDYEPMSVPMFFPVLFDINLKLQFKKAEQVIAKTVDYIILLITMGDEPDKGGVNQEMLNSMNGLFATESVGRVLVADYTTEMDFVLPDLKKILGPEKYTVVDKDINSGLINIFFGEDKFSASMVKIKVFLERLKEARKAYLEMFLIPEMERIAKELGFKNIPAPEFEDVDLRDEVEYWKVYNRLAEIGFLTPEETINAYQTYKLPLPEDSVENQKKLKEYREDELYMPVNSIQPEVEMPEGAAAPPAKKNVPGEKGRPTGGNSPRKDKKAKKPAGASTHFSMTKIKENTKKMSAFQAATEAAFKERFSKKRLSKKAKEEAFKISTTVMGCVTMDKWEESLDSAFEGGLPLDMDWVNLQAEIASEHNLTDELSVILLANSITDAPDSGDLV